MKVVCLSDTHGHHDSLNVPEGDLLIHAGNFIGADRNWHDFLDWFGRLPHGEKILTLGTRETDRLDREHQVPLKAAVEMSDEFHLVMYRSVEVAGRLVSPESVSKRPDIVVSHEPPKGILDEGDEGSVGNPAIREYVFRRSPKLHVFGHVPQTHGTVDQHNITFVNAALGDSDKLINNPIIVDIE